MAQNGSNWHRQERAITALLGGATLDKAAEAAGVSRRTITRWRREPAFRDRLRELADDSLVDARNLLRAILPKAVGTLAALLVAPDDGVKLRAAAILLRGLIAAPLTGAPSSSARLQGRVMLVPAQHLDIIAGAFQRNQQPGDPTFVFLPDEEPLSEESA